MTLTWHWMCSLRPGTNMELNSVPFHSNHRLQKGQLHMIIILIIQVNWTLWKKREKPQSTTMQENLQPYGTKERKRQIVDWKWICKWCSTCRSFFILYNYIVESLVLVFDGRVVTTTVSQGLFMIWMSWVRTPVRSNLGCVVLLVRCTWTKKYYCHQVSISSASFLYIVTVRRQDDL